MLRLKLLGGVDKRQKIPNGTRVKLGGEFKTGSGTTYPAGSIGTKVKSYAHGWQVTMDADGITLTVPSHCNTITFL